MTIDPTIRRKLWFAAIKPPMYTVAFTPIVTAAFAWYSETNTISYSILFSFLFAAVSIIAWLNLTNDVYDFDTGIDENKQESIVNLCGKTKKARDRILYIALIFLSIGFKLLANISYPNSQFDATVLSIIAMAVFGGYTYQGPPFRLGYYGLGEIICFTTWILSICAAYYSQLSSTPSVYYDLIEKYPSLYQRLEFIFLHLLWSKDHYLCAASFLVAIPTAIILFCSHFHQLDDDKKSGKLSPIVRLGTQNAAYLLQVFLILLFGLEWLFFKLKMIPIHVLLFSLLSLPYAWDLSSLVRKSHHIPAIIRPAKYYAVKFHFVHGCLISLGFYFGAGKQVTSW